MYRKIISLFDFFQGFRTVWAPDDSLFGTGSIFVEISTAHLAVKLASAAIIIVDVSMRALTARAVKIGGNFSFRVFTAVDRF
nr:hypothetical protein [Halarsenatibacter silvermanii]